MNTAIVWVLMSWSYGGYSIPTIEFKSQEKCEVAAIALVKQADPHYSIGSMRQPWCARIEK